MFESVFENDEHSHLEKGARIIQKLEVNNLFHHCIGSLGPNTIVASQSPVPAVFSIHRISDISLHMQREQTCSSSSPEYTCDSYWKRTGALFFSYLFERSMSEIFKSSEVVLQLISFKIRPH